MSARPREAAENKKNNWIRAFQILCTAWVLALSGCMGAFEADPLIEYSTETNVRGTRSQVIARQLRAGVYLVEVREHDIDLRVAVDAGATHTELADAYLRNGVHRTVVSLDAPGTLRVTLASVDQRSWEGGAGLRILRWPRVADDVPSDERLAGFVALGRGNALVARDTVEGWRASIAPLREAAEHFRAANDLHSLAEAEYQRGQVEFSLLLDFDAARKAAQSAQTNFLAVEDGLGAARAELLASLADIDLTHELSVRDQSAALDGIKLRITRVQRYFEGHEAPSDALQALRASALPDQRRGRDDAATKIYEELRARAHERGDLLYEVMATQDLAAAASRNGEMAKAAAMYAGALPLIERTRNPDLYATLVANLGACLIALGEFDRALVLQTEALELFSARGDDGQTARALTALGALQFRTGNVARAFESLRSALPMFERTNDLNGLSAALRLTGNAAAELGHHDLALEYLRKAENLPTNADVVERTRVLIAGELRLLGDLRGADRVLAPVLRTSNEEARADALAERALLRRDQHRGPEALDDLRAADASYASLKLDFNRIDTSAALALASLDAGDLFAARAAADTAVAIETRIRVKSADPELRARFLAASYAPYEARIEVDLASAPPRDAEATWRAFRTAEAVRARSLADRLAPGSRPGAAPRDVELERLRGKLTALQIELERRAHKADDEFESQSDGATLRLRRMIDETRARLEARLVSTGAGVANSVLEIPESRAAVQAELPADTAVLAYFVGDTRSHAWLLTRAELRHAALPGRHALENLVNTFIEQERSGERSTTDATFAPLLANLLTGIGAHRLVVLPDGPLNGLPFAALPLPHGQSRELLVDRYVIATASSLALALRPVTAQPAALRVAVVSDPVYTTDDRRLTAVAGERPTYRGVAASPEQLPRLPYSAIEARAVVRAFDGADIIELAGFNATARRVLELPADGLGVLHFATHAVARRDAPEQSALFLSEYAADGTPLAIDRLTAEDITRSGLHANLVVLSGCATGDGGELRGEGVLGLTYGFLANGSRTVVASLWPVEDALTARFMEEFYAAYRVSGRAADALRSAQLRSRGSAAANVWASFIVRTNEIH